MKVIISSGEKTPNIIKNLNDRLKSTGIEFIGIPYIEGIKEIFSRGEYFDRAILIEYCWTKDSTDGNQYSIRNKINQFSIDMNNLVNKNVTYIMVSETEEMAELVNEEIMSIRQDTALLLRPEKYTVKFFTELVRAELNNMPEQYLYIPKENNEPEKILDNTDDTEDTVQDETENPIKTGEIDESALDDIGFNNQDFEEPFEDTDGAQETDDTQDDEGFDDDFEKLINDNTDDEKPETAEDDTGFEDGFGDDFDNGFEDIDFDSEPNEDTDTEFEPDDIEDENGDNNFEDLGDKENNEYPEQDLDDDSETPKEDLGFDEGDFGDSEIYQKGRTDDTPQDDIESPKGVEESLPKEQVEDDISNQFGNDDYQPEQYTPNMDETDPSMYDQSIYDKDESKENRNIEKPKLTNQQIKAAFDTFAHRGTSILITGCGGCGTSIIAHNIANTLCNIGYSTLLVDMDTMNKTQSYISKDSYEAIPIDSAAVMSAVNSSSGINADIAIVRQGFHMLTMGMASDAKKPGEAFNKDRLSRFVTQAKNSHQFVVYDIPFINCIDELADLTMLMDDIVIVTDTSNWGISKTLINMCNIESDEVAETLFSRGQLLFNKFNGLSKLFGKKVKKIQDIPKLMDKKMFELIGGTAGYNFSDMAICGTIRYSDAFENGWYSDVQVSDTKAGFEMFIKLLQDILLHS